MRVQYVIYLFVFAYILFQLIFLAYMPLPWFDETFFASMSESFYQTGELKPQVAIFEEVRTYGFVYFLLVSISYYIFGFGIWSFRLVNFVAGLACIWIFRKILWQNILPQKQQNILTNLLPLLIIFDPFFNQSWHEGRMDLTALFFILLSLLYLQKGFRLPKYSYFIISALSMAFALLTTPRIGFICLAFIISGIIFFFQNVRKHWIHTLVWAVVLLGTYQIWVWYAFGTWVNLWQYYMPNKTAVDGANNHLSFIGFNTYIPRQTYLLIFFAVLSLGYGLLFYVKKYLNHLFIILLVSILLFYALVFDFGPYSIFILFFYYFILFYPLFFKKINFKNPIIYLIALLMMFNFAYSGLKNLQILASLEQRNFTKVEQFIQKYIPKGSKVIGEPMYYYAVRNNQSDYQYFDLYDTLENREKRQRIAYQYEYLIITEHIQWRKPDIVAYYLKNAKLQKVASFKIPRTAWSLWIDQLGLVSNTERFGYDAMIYQRIE